MAPIREAELPDLGKGKAIDTSIPADPDVKTTLHRSGRRSVFPGEPPHGRPDLNATAAERVKTWLPSGNCVNELIDLQMDEYTPDRAITEKQNELKPCMMRFLKNTDLSMTVPIGWHSPMILLTISCARWKCWTMTAI